MKRSELRKIIKEELLKEQGDDDLKKIASEITKKLRFFGFSITVSENDMMSSDNWNTVKTVKISPRTIGMLGPVFTSIEAQIDVAYVSANRNLQLSPDYKQVFQGAAYLVIRYNWEHPRGSNGYTIRYQLYNGKWEDQS